MDHGGAAAVQAAVGGPALLATVAAMSRAAKSKAEDLRTREGRAVVSVTVTAMTASQSLQWPRPGWLVAEPTGIGRSRGRARRRPVSAGCGGGERRARDASVKDLLRAALEPRERRHTSCSNRQQRATTCSMQHATAGTMSGVSGTVCRSSHLSGDTQRPGTRHWFASH